MRWSVEFVAQNITVFVNTTNTLGCTCSMPLLIDVDTEMFGEDSAPPWAGVQLAPKRKAEGATDGEQQSQKELKGKGKGEDSLVTKVAMLSLATAREQALLSFVVLSTYLIPAESYLAKAGLAANKFYADMVKALHDRKAAGEDVDLSTPGPPFITVFFMTTRALMKMAPEEKSPQYMGSMIRHFTVRAPRGPGSKKMEGKVRMQFALGPNPLSSAVNVFLEAALTDLKATQLVGSAPKGPLERQITNMLQRRG
ncbi:unnamed protein product [Prorocentrum cordatum]|uniref:Uncharacterized protein n=1 Tax=Prorocentrum cordatum TaxID=2364126 RepID=A0ABN9TCQ0_9DINO|nr:unnamed protein product [Polarella glacialis]